LVASRDPRFARVSYFLLQRCGFAVETTSKPSRLLDHLQRWRANVVVLDCSDSLAVAARTVAAIQASTPQIGVVLVDESPEPVSAHGLPVLPKWTAFKDLVEAIESVHAHARTRVEVAPVRT
jgi:hypothetical protein